MTKVQRRELARLDKALRDWRATNKSPTPLPTKIWDGAIKLAGQLGVGAVSRTLHLDHSKLKRLTDQLAPVETPTPPVATFMELKVEHPPTGTISCALEIESAGGGILRARLDGVTPYDLGAVFKTFGN